ncbi:MAG: hypothetical protein ACRETX_16500, partial [Steroidobacteraceae bacterium]
MRIDRFGRRSFLIGSGGAFLALPPLPSLFARLSPAKTARPLRFFAIKSYSTQRLVDWYPRFAGNGYRVRPFDPSSGKADGTTILNQKLDEPSGRHRNGRQYFARFAPLKELSPGGRISTILGSSLAPY